jgi:hypothetical protein
MSDLGWHDDRIPMEYRIAIARQHNEKMEALAQASEREARRLHELEQYVLAEQAIRDAAALRAQVVAYLRQSLAIYARVA